MNTKNLLLQSKFLKANLFLPFSYTYTLEKMPYFSKAEGNTSFSKDALFVAALFISVNSK